MHLRDETSIPFSKGIIAIISYLAKGLEFDEVIVPVSNINPKWSVTCFM